MNRRSSLKEERDSPNYLPLHARTRIIKPDSHSDAEITANGHKNWADYYAEWGITPSGIIHVGLAWQAGGYVIVVEMGESGGSHYQASSAKFKANSRNMKRITDDINPRNTDAKKPHNHNYRCRPKFGCPSVNLELDQLKGNESWFVSWIWEFCEVIFWNEKVFEAQLMQEQIVNRLSQLNMTENKSSLQSQHAERRQVKRETRKGREGKRSYFWWDSSELVPIRAFSSRSLEPKKGAPLSASLSPMTGSSDTALFLPQDESSPLSLTHTV